MSDILWSHELYPARILCPWNFPGKNIGVGCHFFLQGIFLTQGSNLYLLHWKVDSLPLSHLGSPAIFFFFSSLFKPKLSRCGQLESFQIATVSFWQDPMICCWKQTHQDISSGNLNINVGDTPKLLCFIIFYSASQLVQWKVPRRKKWQPTPVFLPGESHGQRSLEGYSPWSHKESDMIEHTRTHNFY